MFISQLSWCSKILSLGKLGKGHTGTLLFCNFLWRKVFKKKMYKGKKYRCTLRYWSTLQVLNKCEKQRFIKTGLGKREACAATQLLAAAVRRRTQGCVLQRSAAKAGAALEGTAPEIGAFWHWQYFSVAPRTPWDVTVFFGYKTQALGCGPMPPQLP